MKVGLVRPTPLDLPVVELPRACLFQRLSVDRIALLIKCILLEKRIILVSSTECELMAVGETLRSLIFPLVWRHLYIPLMNRNVGSKLHAHTGPFLVGVPRFMLRRPEFSKFPKHSIVVYLDKNEIRILNNQKSITSLSPMWPTEYKRRLQKVMENAAMVFTDTDQNQNQIQRKDRVFETLTSVFGFMCQVLHHTKTSKNLFTKKFQDTQIYKEFLQKYQSLNASDRKLSRVRDYYMNHQRINLGFGMPKRGTLAKIARSTEHYNHAFPTVNEKNIVRNEMKKKQKYANSRPKRRPKGIRCNQEALYFLNMTLLSTNTKASKNDEPVPAPIAFKHSTRRSFIEQRQGIPNTRARLKSEYVTILEDPTNITIPEQENDPENMAVLQKLESIIAQMKTNRADLNAFQQHMDQIQRVLTNSATPVSTLTDAMGTPKTGTDTSISSDPVEAMAVAQEEAVMKENILSIFRDDNQSGDDNIDEMVIDEDMISRLLIGGLGHERTGSMSSVNSSSNMEDSTDSEESWGFSSGTSDEEEQENEARRQVESAKRMFRNLNEFDLDMQTCDTLTITAAIHNECIGNGTISISYQNDLLSDELLTRYRATLV